MEKNTIPVTMKVTKREPYYDWTIHQLKFSANKETYTLRIPFDNWSYDYDILYYIKEQGVDISEMSLEMWKDFIHNGEMYKSFKEWVSKQWEEAKQGGSSHLVYTYRKRHLDGIWWKVTITLHMFGQERKVIFPASCRYESIPSDKTLHDYVFDTICSYLGKYDTWFHMSKEQWEDNETFKKLMEGSRKAIEAYNSGELQRNSW